MAAAEAGKCKAVMILNGSGSILEDGENVKIMDVPVKECSEGKVKVQVQAFATNPVDLKINALMPQYPMEHIPCSDAAGTIVEVGSGVDNLQVGDQVFLNTNITVGTASEMIVVDSGVVARRGDMTSVQAAGLPLVSVTAMDALNALGDLEEGSLIMINGASGGVGTMAVQIAVHVKGYRVIGVCSGKNEEMVKGLGAEEVINYKEQNFAEYDRKIDGFVELATPGTYEGAKQILKENAPYVTIAVASEEGMKKSMELSSDAAIQYEFVFYTTTAEKLDQIAAWVAEKKLKPMTHATFTMEQIMDAFKEQKTNRATGKIVVTTSMHEG